jgi:hypothetical protein
MGFETRKTRSSIDPAVAVLCLTLLLIWGPIAYGESMLGTPATIDEVNVEARTMEVTYAEPDSKETKHVAVQWDKSTEFIKEGPPPDMKETPAKPEDIKRGAKVYIRITDEPANDGKHRLDAVRIKP